LNDLEGIDSDPATAGIVAGWVDVEMDASILTDETLKQNFRECFSKALP
jgi:hypothetical protein